MSTLGSYLEAGDILLGVHATNKQQLFEVIGKHLQTAHGVPAESVALSLQRRELAASTALGYGCGHPARAGKGTGAHSSRLRSPGSAAGFRRA